jgi:PAT family beta-lactamase induction signal transducer AmpG
MLIPLLVRERPGDRLFPWSDSGSEAASGPEEDTMTFGEIITGFKTAVSDNAAKMALLLCTVMWIGGGMGTGMGVIDFQWEFLFVDELGWDSQDYLDAKGLPVFLMTMLGFLVGGLLGSKFGSKKTLTYAVAVGTVMTIVWSMMRSQWTDSGLMLQIWLVWTLVWAIVGANLLAFLMSVTTKEFAGTQFSIYMTLINVGAFVGNALSPQILDLVGGSFPNLFLFGAAFQALVFVVLSRIDDHPTPLVAPAGVRESE